MPGFLGCVLAIVAVQFEEIRRCSIISLNFSSGRPAVEKSNVDHDPKLCIASCVRLRENR